MEKVERRVGRREEMVDGFMEWGKEVREVERDWGGCPRHERGGASGAVS